MPYVIDGNNLVGCAPDISLDDPQAKTKIINIARNFQENKRCSVIMVFDGPPGKGVRREELSARFTVLYPREGSSADEEIRQILSGFNYFKDVVLVTSDRKLKDFAREKGAKTLNSIEFYFELKRLSLVSGEKQENLKRINTELSDREVDQWLKIFHES